MKRLRILGRGLSIEEAEYVTEMSGWVAALILMQKELDENYEAVKDDTWVWPLSATVTTEFAACLQAGPREVHLLHDQWHAGSVFPDRVLAARDTRLRVVMHCGEVS